MNKWPNGIHFVECCLCDGEKKTRKLFAKECAHGGIMKCNLTVETMAL